MGAVGTPTRESLKVGDKVTWDGNSGTVVPTSPQVPVTEVNVMLDGTGSVGTIAMARLDQRARHVVGLDDLHAHLETVWPQAQRWSSPTMVVRKEAAASSSFLQFTEQQLVTDASARLARSGRSMLTTTGPQWTELDCGELGPAVERPWRHGDPIEWDLACRMSGLSIPLLTEEPR
mgnify:CR=1 FL=1